jgi:hypothetical protein
MVYSNEVMKAARDCAGCEISASNWELCRAMENNCYDCPYAVYQASFTPVPCSCMHVRTKMSPDEQVLARCFVAAVAELGC